MLTRKFDVIPAIDVLDGRVVRLSQGRRDAVTLERGDPAALARKYSSDGARWLHVVDLDGAFSGTPTVGLLRRLTDASALPIQIGGGYRTIEGVQAALGSGASRVMVGTAALESGFLHEAVGRFGESLVVAIDVRDGRVATDGWERTSTLPAAELARRCAEAGVARLLVTSTARDGSLAGPDLPLLEELVAVGLPVIAAGGVSSLEDLEALRELGCEAAIAGSALLAGRFTLPEALAVARE